MTEQEEPLSVASPNSRVLPLHMNGTLDSQDDSWVIVNPETNITYSKNLALCNELPNQCMTEQEEPLSVASPNSQALPLHMNGILDSQDDSWVIVNPETNITYSENLALVMEYIYDELQECLSGTINTQQIHKRSTPIKLVKEVYLAADPEIATHATRAADEQIQQSYELLLKSLCTLQYSNCPVIKIDINPILERIGYSPNKSTLRKCSIEGLIEAVEKLNHASERTNMHCLVL